MHWINWLIVVVYIVYVAVDGIRRTKDSHEIEGYFLAKRSLPWWVVGLSVMATQLSAITMVGTTGQGAIDGIRFIQFYFGLPLAMIILSVTLIPFLYGAKVFTAYEYLERRFDARTRGVTSLLFLMSRGMSAGVIISAPAVIFSVIFGLSLPLAVAMIGIPTVLYTMFGGVQAVAWADVKQMVLIVFALLAIVVALVAGLPQGVGLGDALAIAGETGRLRVFDFDFNVNETYTFWSGLIGGTFLALSYFGTDQSQVQRHLTARSVDEARSSLLMSAYWKIPLQALVLIVGVLVFVYYLFAPAPLHFNPAQTARVQASERATEFAQVEASYRDAAERRRVAAEQVAAAREAADRAEVRDRADAFLAIDAEVRETRDRAAALVGEVTGGGANDVNYIIPTFVLNELPLGLTGIFIAAVLAAAMSSIAAELNALSTTTIIDFYRRHFRPVATDAHFLAVSKVATGLWGLFACIVAIYAARLGSLIEVVNRFGSFFYGSILGVFLLAMIPRATGRGAFYGLIVGMSAVAAVSIFAPSVSFLWHNVIGALAVVFAGVLLSLTQPPAPSRAAAGTGVPA